MKVCTCTSVNCCGDRMICTHRGGRVPCQHIKLEVTWEFAPQLRIAPRSATPKGFGYDSQGGVGLAPVKDRPGRSP
jgi:hypothetical protein